MANGGTSFFSPEAVAMLPLAILIDAIGIALLCFGSDDFFITDIIGLLFIGGWSYFRSMVKGGTQETEMPTLGGKKGAVKTAKQTQRATKVMKWTKRLKWLRPLCVVGEIIPYTGWLPFWTVFVYFELKYS